MNEVRKQLQSLHKVDTVVGDVGTTIRNGTKWYNQVVVGETIDLVEQKDLQDRGTRVGVGRVTEKKLEIFHDIRAKDIDNEHADDSRNYSGLLASMRKAYGSDYSEDSVITVLKYRRIA